MSIQIRDVETDADRAVVRDLLVSEFDIQPGVGAAFAGLYDVVPNGRSRVAVKQGRIVGHALLASRDFWIADRRVPGGVLAMVVVDAAHRSLGIGSALVHDALSLARENHFEFLHVAGDPHFYLKFGFVPSYCWAIAELEAGSGQGDDLRAATVVDIDRLAALSAGEVSSGSVVADVERWRWVLETEHPASLLKTNDRMLSFHAREDACWMLEDVGFARACWHDQALAVYEAAITDDQTGERLLDALLCRARSLGCPKVQFFLPIHSRLIRAVERKGGLIERRENGEQLALFLDIPRVLMRLMPVFSQRARLAGVIGRLGLRIGDLCLKLEMDRSGVTLREADRRTVKLADWHLVLPEIAVTRALLGTDRLADRVGEQADDSLRVVLDALFPVQMPFFSLADAL